MRGNYDIVHSHELFHSGMVLYTAKKAGVKCRFAHAHNWSDGDGTGRTSIKRKLYNAVMRRMILRYGTDFCACSTLAGKFLYGQNITKDPRYHLIVNSVDTSAFIDNYDRAESGEFTGDGWVSVLQIGRFSAVKNQLFTAEIARELKRRGRKIRILCAGNNGNEYEKLVRDKIAEYSIGEYMQLLGIRNDIDVLMRKSSAFLLPSLYEGMPLVMIEAQASGLWCVSADTFSHEVEFDTKTIVWMSLSDSAEKWADALERAINSPRPDKSSVVQAVEKGGFDSQSFARKLCGLYEAAWER
jgi:glycosyltransferase EpsF